MTHCLNLLTMGSYTFYVWSAYGLAVAVLGLNTLFVKRRRSDAQKRLHQWSGQTQ